MSVPIPAPVVPSPSAVGSAGLEDCALVDHVSLALPNLPSALADFTLLHLTDLHVTGPRRRHGELREILARAEVDLLLLTGDFMTRPGDEAAAEKVLRELMAVARPRHGTFGVWGNHDTPRLRERCNDLPVRWLNNDAAAVAGLGLTVLGVDCEEDHCPPAGCLETAMGAAAALGEDHFRLLLAHIPSWLTPAAGAGVPLVLSGHTHGGQIRLPWVGPLLNMTPGWPLRLSSGVLRQGDTHAVVSRGVGESVRNGLRFLCPPHVPLITLREGESSPPCVEPACVRWW